MRASAELIEDRGDAVSADEFFRCSQFLAAEGVTHTLRISADAGDLLAPLVVRGVPGADAIDAISPYGYPGIVGPDGLALDPGEIDWAPTGLVSVFLRHRLGAYPPLHRSTARNEVQIADPALPRKSRPSDRQQIRRNAERGYAVRRIAGGELSADDLAGFLSAYTETMQRAGAGERYMFGEDYFSTILGFGDSRLLLVDGPGGKVAAGSVVVRSDGLLHYYLSGTADRFLSDSPMKTLVSALLDWAEEAGLPVNLGGGIQPGDRLEEFKRGFANRTEAFRSSEVVADEAAYDALSSGRTASDYFPAYRAPAGDG